MNKERRLTKRIMGRNKILLTALAVALTVSFFTGCSTEKVTKEERLQMFLTALNSSTRSGIQDNFVAGLSNSSSFTLEFGAPGACTYSWSGGTGTGTFTRTSGSTGQTSTSGAFTWQDTGNPLTGENWKILKLSCGIGTYTNEEPAVSE